MWNRIEDLENWCHHINMRMIGLKEGLEPGGMIKYVYNILSEGLGIEIERAHHVLTLRPVADHLLTTPCEVLICLAVTSERSTHVYLLVI